MDKSNTFACQFLWKLRLAKKSLFSYIYGKFDTKIQIIFSGYDNYFKIEANK